MASSSSAAAAGVGVSYDMKTLKNTAVTAFAKDVDHLITVFQSKGDDCTFSNFKLSWKDIRFGRVHKNEIPSIQRTEYMQWMFQELLNRMEREDRWQWQTALFIIYALYMTQNDQRAGINVTKETWGRLLNRFRSCQPTSEFRLIFKKLLRSHAFVFAYSPCNINGETAILAACNTTNVTVVPCFATTELTEYSSLRHVRLEAELFHQLATRYDTIKTTACSAAIESESGFSGRELSKELDTCRPDFGKIWSDIIAQHDEKRKKYAHHNPDLTRTNGGASVAASTGSNVPRSNGQYEDDDDDDDEDFDDDYDEQEHSPRRFPVMGYMTDDSDE